MRDENLADLLGLQVGTYNVEEMLPADSNSFSSLHNKLSAANISAILSEDKVPENSLSSGSFQLPVTEDEEPDFKRKFSSLSSPTEFITQPSKRQKTTGAPLSSVSTSHHGHVPTLNMPVPRIKTETPNVLAHNSLIETRIQSGLGTVSTLPTVLFKGTSTSICTTTTSSLQCKIAKGLSVTVANNTATSTTKESIPPQISTTGVNSVVPSITSPSSSISRSQPPISYLITTPPPNKVSAFSSSNQKTTTSRVPISQFVPIVLNSNLAQGSGVTSNSSQMVPVILNSKSGPLVNAHQTIMVAAPGLTANNKPVHSTAMPIVLSAPPGSQMPAGNATVVLTSPNSAGNSGTGTHHPQLPQQQPHHIYIRQSLKQQQQQLQHLTQSNISQQQKSKIFVAPNHLNSPSPKSQLSLLGTGLATTMTTSVALQSVPRTVPQISRFSSNPKPAEVKVSRRLFHEATASSSSLQLSSSNLANGHLNTLNTTTSHVVKSHEFDKDFGKGNSMTKLDTHKITTLPIASSTIPVTNISDINIPPNFIGDGVVNSAGDEDVMDTSFDISTGVLGSIGFSGVSGDDLVAPLNTSSSPSVLLSSTSLSTNAVTGIVNDMATIPAANHLSYSRAAEGGDSHVNASDLSLINSNVRGVFSDISPSSSTLKDSIIVNSSLVSSNFMTSVSDLINPPAKPSSPLLSSPSKDNLCLNNAASSVSFNLPSIDSCDTLTSQMLKSEENPSTMINELDGLTFADQTSSTAVDQLGGIPVVLPGNNVVNILPEQMAQSYEPTDSLLQTSSSMAEDDLDRVGNAGEEDGQLLLPEGCNVFQTEDGTVIIETADGIRYQLASAQGLPIEAVQTAISGNLSEVNGDGIISDGTVQTDVHLQ